MLTTDLPTGHVAFSFSCSTLVMFHSPVLILVIDMIIRRIQICGTGYWL